MDTASDRTARAVRAQLDAMACPEYEVGLRDAERGTMVPRRWTREQLERSIPWLQRMNGRKPRQMILYT
ncbi:MAG: hypothetical protein JOZ41_11905 [Chloroflexi bacterium]|nr:hypothetical protein [Chloroflexota bacterium]